MRQLPTEEQYTMGHSGNYFNNSGRSILLQNITWGFNSKELKSIYTFKI